MELQFDKQKLMIAIAKAPLLSSTASQLLQKMADPNCEHSTIVNLVKNDFALTAQVLRVVNSAAMGLVYPVNSIDRAISFLGTRMVLSIAMANSASQIFSAPLEGYDSEKNSLWEHALFTAIAAQLTAPYCKTPIPADLAFTGGLLHDIGKAILSEFLKGSAAEVIDEIRDGKVEDYLEAEQERFQVDHSWVGNELAKAWNLPQIIRDMILFHHEPSKADPSNKAMVYAVHLGDILAMMEGHGTGSDTLQYQLDPEYIDYFNISETDLATILVASTEEYKKAKTSMDT